MSGSTHEGPLLAFDTSGDAGSVAVGQGGEVLAQCALGERTQHARRLVPAVDSLLGQAGIPRQELAGVVVGAGPGSFTGIRVAAATAKGLCQALDLPLHPVSSLRAAALGTGTAVHIDALRAVLFDARSDRVFAGWYGVRAGRIVELEPPEATTVGAVLSGRRPAAKRLAMGSGARRHAARLQEAGWEVLEPPWGEPSAESLLRVYWQGIEDGAGGADAALWKPVYLKDSSASPSR